MMRSILGAALIGLSVIAMVADASPNDEKVSSASPDGRRWGDGRPGRYKMMPRVRGRCGLMPVTYTQLDWALRLR